jgi:hypothetical protein
MPWFGVRRTFGISNSGSSSLSSSYTVSSSMNGACSPVSVSVTYSTSSSSSASPSGCLFTISPWRRVVRQADAEGREQNEPSSPSSSHSKSMKSLPDARRNRLVFFFFVGGSDTTTSSVSNGSRTGRLESASPSSSAFANPGAAVAMAVLSAIAVASMYIFCTEKKCRPQTRGEKMPTTGRRNRHTKSRAARMRIDAPAPPPPVFFCKIIRSRPIDRKRERKGMMDEQKQPPTKVCENFPINKILFFIPFPPPARMHQENRKARRRWRQGRRRRRRRSDDGKRIRRAHRQMRGNLVGAAQGRGFLKKTQPSIR